MRNNGVKLGKPSSGCLCKAIEWTMEPACLIWWMRKTKQRSHIDFFTKTPIMNAFFFSMDTLLFI